MDSEIARSVSKDRPGRGEQKSRHSYALVVAGLTLSLMLGAAANAQQQDQSQQQPQAQSPDQGQQQAPPNAQPPADQSQPQTAPPTKAAPKYYPQDANRPPYNNDRGPSPYTAPPPSEYGQDAQGTPDEQQGQGEQAPRPPYRGRTTRPPGAGYANHQPTGPPPATPTIPPGTILSVRMNEFVSSDKNQVGDRITATLERPIVVNGWVVARRGQTLSGQVTAAVKAGRVKGTSQLGLELTDLSLVDGQSAPILTEIWKGSGGTSHGEDAATIGGTTALGAAIGAAADWGRGAAIGAGAGAAAGIAAVLLTRGRPTEILPETPMTFRLVDPLKVDTTQGTQAFAPVTQEDYGGGQGDRHDRRYAGGYPPSPPPCNYYGPCYAYPVYPYPVYAYPYPYVGVYGGWGWHRGSWR